MFILIALPNASYFAAGMSETIERIKPSIVAMSTYQKTRSPAFAFRGTGFSVGDGTLVATNARVLPDRVASESREILVVVTIAPSSQAEGGQDGDFGQGPQLGIAPDYWGTLTSHGAA